MELQGKFAIRDGIAHGWRITTDFGEYYPSPAETKALADWGCFKGSNIMFPPHHPNDTAWEAENGSYLKAHQFEDAVKAEAKRLWDEADPSKVVTN